MASPAVTIPFEVETRGIPKATAELKKLLDSIEKQGQVTASAKTGAIESPATRVRQSRSAASGTGKLGVDTELQKFINKQTTGLLGTYYQEFNGEEIFRKLQSGAATVTAQGAKPLTDLISFYKRVEKELPVTTPNYSDIVNDLREQTAIATKLRDQVRASLVPQSVLKLNEKAAKAQQDIEAFGTNLRSRGFEASGSYLETVTQFIRSVGQNNTALGDSLKFYEQSLLKETITPQAFQVGIADLSKQAAATVTTAQKNAQNLFKTSLQENAGNYAKAYQDVFAKILPKGLSSKSNVVDQTIANTLNQQLLGSFEKDAFKQLSIKRGEFSGARVIASRAKQPTFNIRDLTAALDSVETNVQNRIKFVTDQLDALKLLAKTSKDTGLANSVKQLEAIVQETITNLRNSVEFERNKIFEAARTKATSKASVTKTPTASADIAVAKFSAEAKSFDATLGKVTDISKGSPRNQGAILENFVRLSNQADDAINELIDVKFRGAVVALNAGLAAQGSTAVVPEDLFRKILDSRGFSREATVAGRVNALSQLDERTIRAQVQTLAPGLNAEQLKVVTDQLIAKTQDIIQSYRVLDEIVDQINIRRLAELRSAEERAITEGRYEDLLQLRANQLLVRGMAGPGVTAGLVQGTLPLNLPDADLLQMGFSAKTIANSREDANRAAIKELNARRREEDDRTPFERLAGFAGRFGAVMGLLQGTIGQVVFRLQEMLDRANELERTSATVSAVAGSFDKFNEVITVAATQQQRFGGTLNEQLQGFTSLVQITRRYNVDLEQLDNVARRLAIIDPLQGFSGAAIALKEFFAGDITSLSRRFEIDRKTLNSVKDIADEGERLQKLDEVLADLGISNAVLAARAQSSAAEFDRLGGNLQNALTLGGTGLQQFLLGDARLLNEWLSEFSSQLAETQLRRERVNSTLTDLARLGTEFQALRLEVETDPASTYFDALTVSVDGSVDSITKLIDKTNELIAQLNTARAEEELPLIPFVGRDNPEFATLLAQAGRLGVNQERILSSQVDDPIYAETWWQNAPINFGEQARRQQAFMVYSQEMIDDIYTLAEMMGRPMPTTNSAAVQQAAMDGLVPAFVAGPFPTEIGNQNRTIAPLLQRAGIITPELRQLESQLLPVLETSLERIGNSFAGYEGPLDANQRAQRDQYLSRYGAEDYRLGNYLASRPDYGIIQGMGDTAVERAQALLAKERADYLTAATPQQAVAEFQQYLQTLIDIIDKQKVINANVFQFSANMPNPYASYIKDMEKIVKQANDQSFGVERTSSAVEFLNGLAKQQNDILADNVLKQFEIANATDDTSRALVEQRAEALGIVDTTDQAVAGTRAQLTVQARAARLQAEYAFEADKSVSILQVLNSEANTFNLSMQQIVSMAVEFNKTMSSFNMGSIMPLLSLEDQLSFTMDRFRPGSLAYLSSRPRNTEESFQVAAQAISLTDKISQDAFDKANKTGDKLNDLYKDYLDDVKEATDDHNKDMKELAEEYYEDMKKLLAESEITKRGNKADFYESLFGMDLTNEQRDAYITQYKGYEEEARKLRQEGNFTAAEEVLNAGSQQILNQAKYDEEVIQNKEKIKDADEEIIDLQKDLKNAKERDDREEIQRKIDKANQDKLDAENRIKQIEGLRQIRADADREEVEQARKKEEQITTDYKTEVAKREQEFKDKLADMEKAYNKSVEDRTKKDDEATRKELANKSLLIELELYRVKVGQLARLITMGASDQAIKNQKGLIEGAQNSILNQAGPELKPIFVELFNSLKTLEASPAQELDPAVQAQLKSVTDNTTALGNNTVALSNLVTTLSRTIVGNRLRVTISP